MESTGGKATLYFTPCGYSRSEVLDLENISFPGAHNAHSIRSRREIRTCQGERPKLWPSAGLVLI